MGMKKIMGKQGGEKTKGGDLCMPVIIGKDRKKWKPKNLWRANNWGHNAKKGKGKLRVETAQRGFIQEVENLKGEDP